MRFKDKVCIVTGSGWGIGRATALRFATEGGFVSVADRSEEGGNGTVNMITQAGGTAMFMKCDVGAEKYIKPTQRVVYD